MHAGDALWDIYGHIAILERQYPADPVIAHIVGQIRFDLQTLGAHISVPEPSITDMQQLVQVLSDKLPARPATAGNSDDRTNSSSRYNDSAVVDAARALLGAMVESGCFDWADMVADIYTRLNEPDPFFTYRQARAILNIARKGRIDDESFLDVFCGGNSEALTIIEQHAAKAL